MDGCTNLPSHQNYTVVSGRWVDGWDGVAGSRRVRWEAGRDWLAAEREGVKRRVEKES